MLDIALSEVEPSELQIRLPCSNIGSEDVICQKEIDVKNHGSTL